MSFVSAAFAWLGSFAVNIIAALGYTGVFLLMLLESTAVPIPAEVVMPFAGFLAVSGRFNLWIVILVAGLGSVAGTLLSYALGRYGGEPLLHRYGRYLLLETEDLRRTERWFARRGDTTVFFARFIPVVRHLIGIPAGIGKMRLRTLCIYTFLGASIWNGFLAGLGYFLGQHWGEVRQYSEPFSYAVAALLVIGLIWSLGHHLRRRLAARHRRNL